MNIAIQTNAYVDSLTSKVREAFASLPRRKQEQFVCLLEHGAVTSKEALFFIGINESDDHKTILFGFALLRFFEETISGKTPTDTS